MSELAELLERFRRGAEMVAVAMTGAAGPELDFVPEPGKWSMRQIIAHLSDAEIVGVVRFRRVIAEEQPVLEGYDQEAWARNLDYAKRKTSPALETFRRIRGENYELLKDLPEPTFERTGIHPKRGPLTLRQLLQIYADHAESHAMQLRTRRAEYKQFKALGAGG